MGKINESVVLVRGGGDIATGVIQKLYRAGFKVVVLEVAKPLSIRRTVSLSSAITQKEYQVEDIEAVAINFPYRCEEIWTQKKIPILVDPFGEYIKEIKPIIVVDCILAKKNLGTNREMAPITIALGPGFIAPKDVDVVIETMRGHSLGKLIFEGAPLPNTGIPGILGGKSAERVIHAPSAGEVSLIRQIGDVVCVGEPLFTIDNKLVTSPLNGTVRGLIANKSIVKKGLKCGDVDPRPFEEVDYMTISDKARAIGGAVLEASLFLGRKKDLID